MNLAFQEINKQKLIYPKLPRYLVESYFALTDFDEFSEYGSMYCPFHDDERGGKPSAKFFEDEDGVQRLYCFSERRQFTSYDYIKLILRQDPTLYLTKEIPEKELLFAVQDYVSNLGKVQMRKSRLDDEEIKNLTETQFIDLISLGNY